MKQQFTIIENIPVSELPDGLIFVSDSQDVTEIKSFFGNHPVIDNYDSFFVAIDEGEYSEVYGMEGIVPYLYKSVDHIDFYIA